MRSSHIDVLDEINAPHTFFTRLRQLEIAFPPTQLEETPHEGNWLFKRPSTCGGLGVERSDTYSQIENSEGYWQLELEGISISALIISDSRDHHIIGINELYSHARFKGFPYVYEGALANIGLSDKIRLKIEAYISNIINHINLMGIFSVDMILQDDEVYVLEINPRISASYELYEQLNPSLNLVDAHIRVCEGERLSDLQIGPLSCQRCGYLIVYADNEYRASPDINWPQWARDIPESGRLISFGEPVCSVYSENHVSSESIRSTLEERQDNILNKLKQ